MKKIKLGLLACGGIANKMARAVTVVENVTLWACAARDLSRAEDFAATYNIPKAYGSYEELVQDKDIDLVYVSTPHTLHYDCVKLCLEAGKNVLCEKPFTTDAAQAKELFELARARGLFLMEAMWTRFLPAVRELHKFLAEGGIGEVLSAHSVWGQSLQHVKRLTDPALAGGALLDMGVYSLTFADLIMGDDIKAMHSTVRMSDAGVDQHNNLLLDYGNGRCATINSSSISAFPQVVSIMGTEGSVQAREFNSLVEYTVTKGSVSTTYSFPNALRGNGFEHQLMEAADCVLNNKIESDIHPGSKTIYMMGLMDKIRAQWGLVYPFEK